MDKNITKWRSSIWRKNELHLPNTNIQSYEKTIAYTASFSFVAFIGATYSTWLFHPNYFPLPLSSTANNIDSQYLTHLAYWGSESLHFLLKISMKGAHANYLEYRQKLSNAGFGYTLYIRLMFGYVSALLAGYYGFLNSLRNPIVIKSVFSHARGMQLIEGKNALRELNTAFKSELVKSGAYAELADGVMWPLFRFVTHSIICGSAGSGKSQLMISMLLATMQMKIKTFILDPKYEFTKGYYEEGSCAILDPSDERSYVWDIAYDLKTIADIKKFAAALIPSKGDNPMWGNAARAVFTGMIIYLKNTFKDENGASNYTWGDISDIITLKPQQLIHIMQNHYPEALSLIGELDEESGEVTTNVTTSGIMINLLAFMGGIRDLSRFWYGNQKKISLFKFMTDDSYPIKTIFAKPNDSEGEMCKGVLRAALVYSMSLVDSPHLSECAKPRIAFYLDEVHSVGKLENESGEPLLGRGFERGRSKGISINISCQSPFQLEEIYSERIMDAWREVSSNFYITGVPLGKTAEKISANVGDRLINKHHPSISTAADGSVSSSEAGQENQSKVILASELSSKLHLTETGIKFYYEGRSLPNVYIVDKPFITIPDSVPHWIERLQKPTAMNPTSRVIARINAEMSGKASKSIEPIQQRSIDELEREYEETDDVDYNFVDSGQYADDNFNQSQPQGEVYDITPDEETDEDEVGEGMIADHVTEVILGDAQTINAVRNILEVFMSSKRITTTDRNEKLKFDANRKNKYSEMLECKY